MESSTPSTQPDADSINVAETLSLLQALITQYAELASRWEALAVKLTTPAEPQPSL